MDLVLHGHRVVRRLGRISCLVLFAVLACDQEGDDTGGTTGSTGAGTTQSKEMDGPPPPSGLRPRWLLRDSNGDPVKAIVEPHCGHPEDCRLPDVGSAPTFRCAHVIMHENRYVGMPFGLADGSPLSCNTNPMPSRRTACSTQSNCTGPLHQGGPEQYGPPRPNQNRDIFSDGEQLYYVSSASPPVEQNCFYLDVIDGCQPSSVWKMFPILPVPDDIMNLLTAGAPYTLEAVYD
jgi:hypothetical protein